MIVDMKPGAELANYLAGWLDDLTFELLVRARIRRQFEVACEKLGDQLSESYNTCSFNYNPNDKSLWNFGIGANYADSLYLKGEVLSITRYNAVRQYELQHGNKLSLLLPAPEPDKIVTTIDPDTYPQDFDTMGGLSGPDDTMKW